MKKDQWERSIHLRLSTNYFDPPSPITSDLIWKWKFLQSYFRFYHNSRFGTDQHSILLPMPSGSPQLMLFLYVCNNCLWWIRELFTHSYAHYRHKLRRASGDHRIGHGAHLPYALGDGEDRNLCTLLGAEQISQVYAHVLQEKKLVVRSTSLRWVPLNVPRASIDCISTSHLLYRINKSTYVIRPSAAFQWSYALFRRPRRPPIATLCLAALHYTRNARRQEGRREPGWQNECVYGFPKPDSLSENVT